METFKTVIGTMRPPFLFLTVSVMLMLLAFVDYQQFNWSLPLFVLILIGALAAHISVNMINEYEDYESGLDSKTERTPFSGGSGSLQKYPEASEWVGNLSFMFLGMVVGLGLFFVYLRGWDILPIGLIGVVIIMVYTRFITHYPWVCLFASGFAFGPLMVYGGYFVLTGHHSTEVLLLSLIPFFLVNNLLLLNQIPDIDADKTVGRFNFLHQYGIHASLKVYLIHWLMAFVVLSALVLLDVLPMMTLIGLLAVVLSLPLLFAVKYLPTNPDKLSMALPINVIVTLITPLLIAVGLFLA